MCGINGIFAYHYAANPIDRNELRRTRDHMATRGPDGTGEWISADERVGFGHRRLAIIDLSDTGMQPMASADGKLVVTFNGEISDDDLVRKARELLADRDRRQRIAAAGRRRCLASGYSTLDRARQMVEIIRARLGEHHLGTVPPPHAGLD